MSRGKLRISAVAVALAAVTAACSPIMTYNGFNPDRNNAEIPDPQVGVDTRETVLRRFGSPSTVGVLEEGGSWYYLSQVQERVAFYSPRITERRVMVVRFDGDVVSAVDKFGLERGRLISYNDDVTPTRGRELGVLEQLLGNIGAPVPMAEEDRGGRPR